MKLTLKYEMQADDPARVILVSFFKLFMNLKFKLLKLISVLKLLLS